MIPYISLFVLGLVNALRKKDILLLVFFLTTLLIPRENSWLCNLSEILMVWRGVDLVLSLFQGPSLKTQYLVVAALYIGLIPFLFTGYRYIQQGSFLDSYPKAEDVEMLNFIRDQIPAGDYIILLAPKNTAEVAPHYTKHTFLNSGWGSEFSQSDEQVNLSTNKIEICPDLECIQNAVREKGYADKTYAVVWKTSDYKIQANNNDHVEQINSVYRYVIRTP